MSCEEVAAEYAKGRFLLIGTADIDARRPIIWDMGKIASYGTPEALDLFVSVMIASASIPVGFPPVMIDVEVDGKRYQEMHVDGGTMAQVFAYPAVDPRQRGSGGRRGYSRAHALCDPQRAAGSGLGASRAQNDEHRRARGGLADPHPGHRRPVPHLRHGRARRRRLQPGVHSRPRSTRPTRTEFDNEYMRQLYDAGYDLALKGLPWAKVPPGFALPGDATTTATAAP